MMLVDIYLQAQIKSQYLEYIRSEFSFVTLNDFDNFFSSILINDISIIFNADGFAFSISGISPFSTWQDGDILVPQANLGSLKLRGEFVAGVSYRANSSDNFWKVVFDRKTGWIEIKNTLESREVVKIFDGVILGLSQGNITALWLQPKFID